MSQLDAEWVQAVQQFEHLRTETTVNVEVPNDERIRLSSEILEFLKAQGEVGRHQYYTCYHQYGCSCRPSPQMISSSDRSSVHLKSSTPFPSQIILFRSCSSRSLTVARR